MRQFVFVVLIAVLGFAADITPAHAQFTFFDFFQGEQRPQPRRYYNRYEDQDRWQQRYERRQQNYRKRAPRKEVSSASPKATEVKKDADAKTILIIGDDMAAGLGLGMREAFAQDAGAVVQSAAIEGASLVKKSADKDIAKTTREKIEALNPAAVVIMLGLHDRNAIAASDTGSAPAAFKSERWKALYQAQLDAVVQSLKTRNVQLYWIGLPPVANKNVAGDIAYMNELYREKAQVAGAKFVDVWEGFVDENGQYIIVGPDVNGNQRRLRLRDGYSLTPAGNRKLAFYAETHLRRNFAFTKQDNAAAKTAAIGNTQGSTDPLVINSFIGPVIALTPVIASKEATLLGDKHDDVTGSVPVAVAKPGRADDFTWPIDTRAKIPADKPVPLASPAKKTAR